MSIIDRNAIFFEGPLKAQATGPVVALTALTLPGRMEPMPVRISVTEGFDPAEVESLALVLEESATADAEASGWTAVPGAAWTAPGASFLRLRLTPTPKEGKTPGKGRIFAALMREDEQPWEAALQKK